MRIKASTSYVRISPRKIRLLTAGLRGKKPSEALGELDFHPQKGSIFLEKLIKQAVANAVNNFKLEKENLVISKIEVNEGPTIKRMDKSHGARFDRGVIRKRNSKLVLELEVAENEEKMPEEAKEKTEKKIIKETTKKAKKPSSLRQRRKSGTKN